jgi:anthranilate synthase component 1
LADPKERAEHLMLVDLGRNDLGRVCAPGTVNVVEFMNLERYSHVMHIVSTVTGKLAEAKSPVYGGAIGYVDFTGNLDTCIAIRTAVIKEKTAYVQAGAGIVADSIPENENDECLNKAAAVLGAIAAANALQLLGQQK